MVGTKYPHRIRQYLLVEVNSLMHAPEIAITASKIAAHRKSRGVVGTKYPHRIRQYLVVEVNSLVRAPEIAITASKIAAHSQGRGVVGGGGVNGCPPDTDRLIQVGQRAGYLVAGA